MYSPALVQHEIDNVIHITRLVTIHYFEFGKDFVFPGETHNVWEVVYVDKGEIVAHAGERVLALRQGDIVFHRPNEFHSLRANGKTAPNVFVITFATPSRLMRFFEHRHFSLPARRRRLIAAIIEEGRRAFRLPAFDVDLNELTENPAAPVGSQQLVRIYLEQLLIQLVRDQTPGKTLYKFLPTREDVDDQVAAEVISFLEQHVYGKLHVEDVCRRVNYGKTYLSSVFHAKTGFTIKQYHTMLKMAEAKRLMREEAGSITDIALMLQYESPQYFSQVFLKTTGMRPSEYRSTVMVG